MPRYTEAQEAALDTLAQQLYTACYGADHKAFQAALTQDIYEWLYRGDDALDRTREDLAAEWRVYVQPEDAEAGAPAAEDAWTPSW